MKCEPSNGKFWISFLAFSVSCCSVFPSSSFWRILRNSRFHTKVHLPLILFLGLCPTPSPSLGLEQSTHLQEVAYITSHWLPQPEKHTPKGGSCLRGCLILHVLLPHFTAQKLRPRHRKCLNNLHRGQARARACSMYLILQVLRASKPLHTPFSDIQMDACHSAEGTEWAAPAATQRQGDKHTEAQRESPTGL